MAGPIDERLSRLGKRYPINEDLVLGVDVGIASVGSAVAMRTATGGSIAFAGSRCFEAPETPKNKELTNKIRRDKRLLRRTTRRRAQRMTEIRKLLLEAGILDTMDPDRFHQQKGAPAPDPWRARSEGLDRKLSDDEFAAALLHIGKHRGFKSNRKADAGQNAPDDNKRMLGAITANQELLARYRTVGEMIAKDKRFNRCKDDKSNKSKRNKDGEYTHTLARDDIRQEVAMLFAAQRKLGNSNAKASLEERYSSIAFYQRPMQDSEGLIGMCPFEPDERRSPRHAPSFERFRFLAKLNIVKVREPDGSLRRLTREELQLALADFGVGSKSVTWNALVNKIGLAKGAFFDGIGDEQAKRDLAASKGCAAGSKTLYDALGPTGWSALRDKPALLDSVATIISFREDFDRIEEGLQALPDLEAPLLGAIINSLRRGDFGAFKGAGHISSKAARNILPHLLQGKVYSKACEAAGYDHTQTRKIEIDDIKNPVVQRSLREAIKQIETLIHHFKARPGRIVVELARDVGKSADERDSISKGIERRTAERERHRAELKELLNLQEEPTEQDLRRYELWKEQKYRCIYTDDKIDARDILANSNTVQIDHILPRSRSQDNSYPNQVLCTAKANQDKKQRTPWEWKGAVDPAWWTAFEARVRALSIKPKKKRNLLMSNFDERERGFAERNLNDTRYASRALLSVLRTLYADDGEPDPASEGYLRKRRRLFAQPGQITSILRRSWGFDGVKDRADDRHHALDAILCAASTLSSEGLLQRLTRAYQQQEEENRKEWVPRLEPPWAGFRDDVMAVYASVFVSRSEKRRARGQGHADTIYGIGIEDGRKVTYERKAVSKLTKGDLARLKDAKGGNRKLAEALVAWIEKGKPTDDTPRSPKGDPVRKVLLRRRGSDPAGLRLNGGHADNADMVRVDVFVKPNSRGKDEHYLVPIYRHQIMDRKRWPQPPVQAVRPHKHEDDWEHIGPQHEFRFSLYKDSLIEVAKRDGQVFEGYFRSMSRSTGALAISPHHRRDQTFEGGSIGARTLILFRKLEVDRLGGKFEVKQETRTWHGEVCT